MNPILRLVKNIMENDTEEVFKMVTKLGVELNNEEKEHNGKALLKTIFMKWLGAADALLEMIITKLPSPRVA